MRMAVKSSESLEAGGGEAGAVVVVGVKVDSRSKELLTWALVKGAQSGDRVIALHVLDPNVGEKFYNVTLQCVFKHLNFTFFVKYILCLIRVFFSFAGIAKYN